jgi:aspartyl-tRNA(Asn)/glutamyl-tRNA(Gln) amidotransferase subunit A
VLDFPVGYKRGRAHSAQETVAVEYVDAVLSAVDRLQPKLNCFVTIAGEQARETAKSAEQAVMTGERLRPLHGIPVGVKDLLPTKGVRTTFGSVAFADHVPDRDDVLVRKLRTAGAIMIGKTTTPEFGIKGQTDGPIFGVTRNPWDLEQPVHGPIGNRRSKERPEPQDAA